MKDENLLNLVGCAISIGIPHVGCVFLHISYVVTVTSAQFQGKQEQLR